MKRTGRISMKDFLIAMVVFRNTTNEELLNALPSVAVPVATDEAEDEEGEEEREIIRFYFNLFDFHGTGAIGLDELKLVIRCFCSSALPVVALGETEDAHHAPGVMVPTEDEIEAMFRTMKRERREAINFEEFQIFYRTLLAGG
jgi:Ca2+-binding EF-hand superfamily protein